MICHEKMGASGLQDAVESLTLVSSCTSQMTGEDSIQQWEDGQVVRAEFLHVQCGRLRALTFSTSWNRLCQTPLLLVAALSAMSTRAFLYSLIT